MNRRDRYDGFLARVGTPLSQFNPGSAEYALDRQAALEAVQALEEIHIAVLGGDVVKIEGERLRYVDNWHVERVAGETDRSFATRSCNRARALIEEFSGPGDSAPLFVLVTSGH